VSSSFICVLIYRIDGSSYCSLLLLLLFHLCSLNQLIYPEFIDNDNNAKSISIKQLPNSV
jgi:hypothetical protein